jgi:DNA invertase Pin-like site-specific DNA recombinase
MAVAFADFERALMGERTRARLAPAKKWAASA